MSLVLGPKRLVKPTERAHDNRWCGFHRSRWTPGPVLRVVAQGDGPGAAVRRVARERAGVAAGGIARAADEGAKAAEFELQPPPGRRTGTTASPAGAPGRTARPPVRVPPSRGPPRALYDPPFPAPPRSCPRTRAEPFCPPLRPRPHSRTKRKKI